MGRKQPEQIPWSCWCRIFHSRNGFDCLSVHNDVQILYNIDNIQSGIPVAMTHDQYKNAVLLIYRPGTVTATEAFFEEFTAYMEVLARYKCRIIVAGDFNIDVERDSEAH